MKNNLIYLVMLAAVVLTASCSTKSDPTPTPAATTNKFTIRGDSYTETSGVDSVATFNGVAYNALGVSGQSDDKSAQAGMIFFFSGTAKPKAGTYSTVSDVTKLGSGKVAILIIEKVSTAKNGILGTIDSGSLTVAVSSSGKLSVNMPSVSLTGSNIDNTNPNNSVVTSIDATLTGTAAEQ